MCRRGVDVGWCAGGAAQQTAANYASYNPVSLVLKDKGWMEAEFAKDNIAIEWVQSAGSNKALEFLQANTVDFGSAAGGAALMARAAGARVKAIYVFS